MLANVNVTIGDTVALFQFQTPATSTIVKLCVALKSSAGFPAVPAELTAVLTGSPSWAILADGQFDQLINKQLTVNSPVTGLTTEQIAARKLVAYTVSGSGGWTRTVLATTQTTAASGVNFAAPITAAGFYAVE